MNVVMIVLLAVSTLFMGLTVHYFFRCRSLQQQLLAEQQARADEARRVAEQQAYEMTLLRAELEPLRRYEQVRDAQAEAARIMQDARSRAALLKADADRYAREIRQAAEALAQ